jgi:hypothetical protein
VAAILIIVAATILQPAGRLALATTAVGTGGLVRPRLGMPLLHHHEVRTVHRFQNYLTATIVFALMLCALNAIGAPKPPKPPPEFKKPVPMVRPPEHRPPPKPKPIVQKLDQVAVPLKKAVPKSKAVEAVKVKPPVRNLGAARTVVAVKDPVKNKEIAKDVVAEITKKKRPEAIEKIVRERNVHMRRFATFNERTGEYSFDSRWWYSCVVYPTTVARTESFQADYSLIVPPANVTVAPPVIKRGGSLPISREGFALAALLDGFDVEQHWLPGYRVDWKTGNVVDDDIEGPPSNGGAFVAAVCFRMKVPMTAATAQNFLPGSQHDWLARDGKVKGWLMVADLEAQLLANQGWVVVAAWRNLAAPGERTVSGQTAIVRPSKKPANEIAKRGPHIIEAGLQNHNDIALKDSFPADAWNNHEVVYFAHRAR